uniref:Uncharacterized protein n=1 Tax=Arundo donax TaxID=35708 RepID=A0A0A9B283_ARUDO
MAKAWHHHGVLHCMNLFSMSPYGSWAR